MTTPDPTKPNTPNTDAQAQALFDKYIGNINAFNNPGGNSKGTDSSKTIVKINRATAKTLLEKARLDNQYLPGITEEDITEFIKKWDAAYAAQTPSTSTSSTHTTTPGEGENGVTANKDSSTIVKQASALDPVNFASDFIWTKVDFGNESNLGGKALGFLQQIRNFLLDNNITGFSNVEVQNSARNLTMGKVTFADFTAKMQQRVLEANPQFAQRLKDNPGASIRSLAQPYISMMAEYLELDENSIKLSDALLDKALRPDGTAGTLPMMSLPDFQRSLRSDPRRQYTIKANEEARQSATSLSSALGFGV